MDAPEYIDTGATLSPCCAYRYVLWRRWQAGGETVAFIGLNPSTADETRDDHTVRRCRGFATAWGYGGLVMVNLFAYRTSDPRVLRQAIDPIGPSNDSHLRCRCRDASLVIAAWGNRGSLMNRHQAVVEMLTAARVRLHCLGTTKRRQPRHPLIARKSLTPQPFLLVSK